MQIDRSKEWDYLEESYQAPGSQIVVVYGNNQLGKSEFLYTFCEAFNGTYFFTEQGCDQELRHAFHMQLNSSKKNAIPPSSYFAILENKFSNANHKQLLIIDEFQYILRNSKTFFKELCDYIDKSPIDLLVCLVSSHVGWVENQMVHLLNDKVNYISGFFKVSEGTFEECSSYFKNYSVFDTIQMYSIVGGQIGYWEVFNREASLKDNLCQVLLNKKSFILTEMKRSIEEQLRETSVYYTILSALSKGKCKLNDIYLYTGFSRAKISVYLKSLMELQFVEKIFSVDVPGRENVQKGVYRIKNNMLYFYFRFLYPVLNIKNQMDVENFYQTYIEQNLQIYGYEKFEDICRSTFSAMNTSLNLPFNCSTIGSWVGKTGTIPILAKNEREQYLVGICQNKKGSFKQNDLEQYYELFKQAKINPVYIYIFSLDGFDFGINAIAEENEHIILIDMS